MTTIPMTASRKRDRFTELFTDHYPTVYNAACVKVGSASDAEDICQEVFIALHNHLDEVENVRAWLFGTLRNKVLEFYRKKSRSDEEIDAIMADAALSFVNGYRDTRIVIGEVIDDTVTDTEDRTVFELVAVYGYSYSETARITGMTKRMVDYRFNMIAKRITSRLKEKGVAHLEDLL